MSVCVYIGVRLMQCGKKPRFGSKVLKCKGEFSDVIFSLTSDVEVIIVACNRSQTPICLNEYKCVFMFKFEDTGTNT